MTTPLRHTVVDWRSLSLCHDKDVDPDLFYSDDPQLQAEAVAFCFMCPVRTECFDWATDPKHRQDHGVWGGTTALERRQIGIPRQRVKCPHCSNSSRIFRPEDAPTAICLNCGLSWRTR